MNKKKYTKEEYRERHNKRRRRDFKEKVSPKLFREYILNLLKDYYS